MLMVITLVLIILEVIFSLVTISGLIMFAGQWSLILVETLVETDPLSARQSTSWLDMIIVVKVKVIIIFYQLNPPPGWLGGKRPLCVGSDDWELSMNTIYLQPHNTTELSTNTTAAAALHLLLPPLPTIYVPTIWNTSQYYSTIYMCLPTSIYHHTFVQGRNITIQLVLLIL